MWVFFGTKSVNKRVEHGLRCQRYCSKCGCTRELQEHRVVKYFTLYFIPLFPIEKGQSVLTCPICETSYVIQPSDYYEGMRSREATQGSSFEQRSPSEKIIIACVQCQKKLRIPNVERTILVTCPHCREQFKVCPRPGSSRRNDIERKIDTILMNDQGKKQRLLEYERQKCPNCSETDLYERVLEHLQRDRR